MQARNFQTCFSGSVFFMIFQLSKHLYVCTRIIGMPFVIIINYPLFSLYFFL